MSEAALQQQIDTLQKQVTSLQQALDESKCENTLLRQKLDALARQYFGKRSEQLNSSELQLLLIGLVSDTPEVPKQCLLPLQGGKGHRNKNNTQRIRTPDNLEVVREVIEPELVSAEPQNWKCISQEVNRLLDYQPGKFFWRETVRPKYVRVDNRALPPVVAPAPVRLADQGMAAPGLLAHILVSK